MHTHICRDCHHTWRHKVPGDATTEQYEQAHMCPACGKGPWRWKFANADEARESLSRPQEEIPEIDTLILGLLEALLTGERRLHR